MFHTLNATKKRADWKWWKMCVQSLRDLTVSWCQRNMSIFLHYNIFLWQGWWKEYSLHWMPIIGCLRNAMIQKNVYGFSVRPLFRRNNLNRNSMCIIISFKMNFTVSSTLKNTRLSKKIHFSRVSILISP